MTLMKIILKIYQQLFNKYISLYQFVRIIICTCKICIFESLLYILKDYFIKYLVTITKKK